MPEEKKSFEELLSGAPLAAKEDTITLVGELERSHHPGRFVLVLGPGRNITLDVDAVKDYRVLAGMVGQTLVEIDVARDRVPLEIREDITKNLTLAFNDPVIPPHTSPVHDPVLTIPERDNTGVFDLTGIWDVPNKNLTDPIGKNLTDPIGYPGYGGGDPYGGYQAGQAASQFLRTSPVRDLKEPWEEPVHVTGTYDVYQTGYADRYQPQYPGGDPYSGGDPYAGYGQAGAPFALATGHQAPASAIAAMGPPSIFGLPITRPWIDPIKRPSLDVKHPWQDGTIPGHPYSDV